MKTPTPPLWVCKVGSGLAPVAIVGAIVGVLSGAVLLLAELFRIYPAPPIVALWGLLLALAALWSVLWLQSSRSLYAKCVAYWHPTDTGDGGTP